MRVIAMDVKKYMDDLRTMEEYYYEHFRNPAFLQEATLHITSYEENQGAVFGGQYTD